MSNFASTLWLYHSGVILCVSGNDDLATDLQHAQVDVYTLNECLEYFFQVDEYHICIHDRTSNQKGACNVSSPPIFHYPCFTELYNADGGHDD